MYENGYMYAIERNDDYLAHYGIRGMKWGVRKAIERGNSRALGRQYRKAQKKLAKLEKRAASGSKYARRAAALGAGAAVAGGLAAGGTKFAGRIVGGAGNVLQEGGHAASRLAGKYIKNGKIRAAVSAAGQAAGKAGYAMKGAQVGINKWGNSNSIGNAVGSSLIRQGAKGTAAAVRDTRAFSKLAKAAGGRSQALDKLGNYANKSSYKMGIASTKAGMAAKGVSNNTIARVGAGLVGAGLAGAAGYNAYRAATTKRAAKKAAQFRGEMQKAFKGTQYENGAPRQGKKRRRR